MKSDADSQGKMRTICMMSREAEEIRIRYLYRDMIIRRRIRVPFRGAVKIIGPDCAYHLYSVADFGSGNKRIHGDENRREKEVMS